MWADRSFRRPFPARKGLRILPSSYHRTFSVWCQGQDSNLRSPSGQRFYRPSVLATHPPWLSRSPERPRGKPRFRCYPPGGTAGAAPLRLEPEGGFEPSTYRLQIGCAAVAPLGQASPFLHGSRGASQQKQAPDESGAIPSIGKADQAVNRFGERRTGPWHGRIKSAQADAHFLIPRSTLNLYKRLTANSNARYTRFASSPGRYGWPKSLSERTSPSRAP
jgi:hypothetical protein